jgi:hypothetical protein
MLFTTKTAYATIAATALGTVAAPVLADVDVRAGELAGVAVGSAVEPAASPSPLHKLLARHLDLVPRDGPDWLVEQSQDSLDASTRAGVEAVQLVLQRDRRDGADLLTLRRSIVERGAVRAYAGAGLNRATYFASAPDEPAISTRRHTHRSIGAAAELGAEMRVSERMTISADLRWAGLDEAAGLLDGEDGPIGADPVALGMTVGWRFR